MRNLILKDALDQLKRVGIRPEVWNGSKHIRLCWSALDRNRYFTIPVSPGDYRTALNNRAQLKRILREDGLLPSKGAAAA